MRLLYRTSALASALALLSGCVQDPMAVYRNVRAGNYEGALSRLSHASLPSGPRLNYGGHPAAAYEASYPLEPLHGQWTGSMDCGGETRSLDLFVFDPHPHPRSIAVVGPVTSRGRMIYEVRGSRGYAGDIQINPAKQITFPPGYRPVAWTGNLQADGTFAGMALGGGCGGLTLRRVVAPDAPAFVEAERDNGRFQKKLLDDDFQLAAADIPTTSVTGRILQGIGLCTHFTCPGINLPGVLGAAPGATSGGARGSAADAAERVREQQLGGSRPSQEVPPAPILFPEHLGTGPGFGITHQ